jgi:hypothetical protein
MKKVLLLAVAIAVLAHPLFAAANTKAADTKASDSISYTSLTKYDAESQYPGLLTPGSIMSLNYFVSDINLLGNVVSFDDFNGTIFGIVLLKTDIGNIGLNVSPWNNPITRLTNTTPNNPDGIFGLSYGTKIASLPFGFSARYGNNSTSYDDTVGVDISNPYTENTTAQYLELKASSSIDKNIDLAIAFSMLNSSDHSSYYYNFGSNWNYDDNYDTSTWQLDLSGRIKLTNDLTTAATITYANGTNDEHYKGNTYDEVYRNTNSILDFSANIGKDFKPTDNLLVRMSGGFNIGGTTNGKYEYIDNIYPGNSYVYYDMPNGDRTQYGFWTIPFNIAVEVKLNDTWSLNSGAKANIVMFNNTDEKYNMASVGAEKIARMSYSDSFDVTPGLTYTLGLTAKIGDLTFETYMNPEIFFYGPNFISGVDLYNESGYLNYGVSFTYSW